MDVPSHVRQLRDAVLQREGGRRDDVEFTFVKGRWNHLGEATLMNRVKSHPDVGERWYPDLLAQIRRQQAQEAAARSAGKHNGSPDHLEKRETAQRSATVQAH